MSYTSYAQNIVHGNMDISHLLYCGISGLEIIDWIFYFLISFEYIVNLPSCLYNCLGTIFNQLLSSCCHRHEHVPHALQIIMPQELDVHVYVCDMSNYVNGSLNMCVYSLWQSVCRDHWSQYTIVLALYTLILWVSTLSPLLVSCTVHALLHV